MIAEDTLSQYEFEADPFSSGELAAIARYREATAGIPDIFDSFELADVKTLVSDYGPETTRTLLREHGKALNTWYLALDSLLADMLTCTAESTRYSVAAARFIRASAAEYHQTRQDFEHVMTVWFLGLDTGPTGDYPPPTRTVNLPMQSLER